MEEIEDSIGYLCGKEVNGMVDKEMQLLMKAQYESTMKEFDRRIRVITISERITLAALIIGSIMLVVSQIMK
jgi:hypothetical protein